MARLLLGKEVTESLNGELLSRSEALKKKGIVPTLALIRVGEDPGAVSYEKGACKRAEAVGVALRQFHLPEDADAGQVAAVIQQINRDSAIHGALLFRPLPKPLRGEQDRLCNLLSPQKDVDCMTHLSAAGIYEGVDNLGFAPCTPEACMEILEHYSVDVCGKNAVVIGRSQVVGKPAAMMLLRRNATVTVCHTRTKNLPEICRRADILVCAAGCLNMVTKEFAAPGQTVIDVSVNWDAHKPNAKGGPGAIAGDTVFSEVEPIVRAITPVPGGVGAVTTSVLMKHVIEAAERA